MSSIQINGNTSGSITIEAPAVAGTNTITLPASTGTIMVTGPAFSAYLSANQTGIANSTWTKAQVNTEEFDTNSNYDNATNYRFTPTVAGYYQVNGCVNFNAATVNPTYVATSIYKNGVSFKITSGAGNGVVDNGQEVSCLVYFNGSTDYVELYGYVVGSTGARFSGGGIATYFQAAMVRSA